MKTFSNSFNDACLKAVSTDTRTALQKAQIVLGRKEGRCQESAARAWNRRAVEKELTDFSFRKQTGAGSEY